MKKLFGYFPLHFTVCLILGICLQSYLRIWHLSSVKMLMVFFFLLTALFVFKNKILHTFFTLATFVFLGISSVYLTNDIYSEHYYQKKLTQKSFVQLTISKVLKQNKYFKKYEAEVSKVEGIATIGKVLLNIQKDSLTVTYNVNDRSDFKTIKSPLNPHQFNYKRYLARQGIHQQMFLINKEYLHLGKGTFSLIGFSASIRNDIQQSLQKHNFTPNTLSVINALLLGQRQDISKDLLIDYTNAGAIHILAVSGLHIGIILLILNFLLKPLILLKGGKILRLFLVLFFLWSFAFIAGLSASVVRAVTMFTFVAIGQMLKRKRVIEFSVLSSAFLLLIVKPLFLFDVGFQLSYLAVFGIIWIQPKLFSMLYSKNWFYRKIWGLITVSVAAQIGVLPLSLYYFHQFPGLFFLSNLLIIPVLGGILIGGICIIILSLLNFLPQFLIVFYNMIIESVNTLVHWISSKEAFLIEGIPVSFLVLIISYLFIITLFQTCFYFSLKKMLYCLVVVFVFQGILLFEKITFESKREFLIFHKTRNSIYGLRESRTLYLIRKSDTTLLNEKYPIENYMLAEHISRVERLPQLNYFKLKNQDFLIVDALGVYKVDGLKNPVILIQGSPKINSIRLIETLHPKQIIVDGNNYTSYVKGWRTACLNNGIPFYYTGDQGAYVLEY